MASRTELPILVAGGGIGGLAAALSLANTGVSVHVLEQAAAFGEIGAGIQLGPNAFHAFDAMGIGAAARSAAVYVDNLILMDAMKDKRIAAIPLDEPFRKRFGNPYAVVHRADLHKTMVDACQTHPKIVLSANSQVVAYAQDSSTVTAALADGRAIKGLALIGADGLWSKIRKQMVGDDPPRVSGHTTYRSVIPTEQMPDDLRWNAATLWAGPKCHIVHYPLKGGKVFNLAVTCHNDAPEPVAGKPITHAEMRKSFEHVCPRALRIIDHGQDWKLWVLCDRDPIETWVDGRVALLGDAAHPTLQYFAQGACMAMEDGVCLGQMAAKHPGRIEVSLMAYNQQRLVRTARIQLGSRMLGDYVYHPSGAAAIVRNVTMGAMTPEQYYDKLQWLYGSTGLDGPY